GGMGKIMERDKPEQGAETQKDAGIIQGNKAERKNRGTGRKISDTVYIEGTDERGVLKKESSHKSNQKLWIQGDLLGFIGCIK
ncbi:MAG: hypothetical protein NC489_45690, partial [Ruminococcus flavefaciens]|nr:hypothetical protein [Ruminococcus flavefaciens]